MRQSEYIVHRTLSKFLKSKAQAQIALGNPRDDVRETWRSPRALRAQIDTSIRYHASQSALRCTPARGKYSSTGAPNQKKKNPSNVFQLAWSRPNIILHRFLSEGFHRFRSSTRHRRILLGEMKRDVRSGGGRTIVRKSPHSRGA
jgi:hypothetical protein